jgi:hypothetical protein
MQFQILADLVAVVHFAFIIYVLFGGVLALRWTWVPWVHLPAVAWGMGIEFLGWYCPLTPLENSLRTMAGDQGYSGGFIEHYLLPVIYPDGLTRNIQLLLGGILVIMNLAVYAIVWRRHRHHQNRQV